MGRTGTLIAVDMILKEIELRHRDEVDVTNVVKSLREQRPKMVQTYVSLRIENLRGKYSFREVLIRESKALSAREIDCLLATLNW